MPFSFVNTLQTQQQLFLVCPCEKSCEGEIQEEFGLDKGFYRYLYILLSFYYKKKKTFYMVSHKFHK